MAIGDPLVSELRRAHSLSGAVRARRPRIAVLYHYFHPDDVVSARHFTEFCTGLAERGWDVEALPCNRGCRDESVSYPAAEEWKGIAIRRLWRPGFRQASNVGRVLNAAWMILAWCAALARRPKEAPDVVVIGTDPVLSILVAPFLRKMNPRIRIIHWCFDLYPESPIAEGMLRADAWWVRGLRRLLKRAYASCDLVADLGHCMRERLETYGHGCRKVTLVPWALAEPEEVVAAEPAVRRELFGAASLGLLYSGNFGRAHSYQGFLELARRLRTDCVHFCFGVRGNRAHELREAIGAADRNVSLAGFAPESALVERLAAADVHLVSLRPEWTGLVVPSKFFGALAAGRPVIFAGSPQAAIARWIKEYGVGWVLADSAHAAIATELRALAADPDKLYTLQRHCHEVYHRHFSRRRIQDEWDLQLRQLLAAEPVRLKYGRLRVSQC
jgi:colanic acid biosynthesis glycosyl transferase WcaI